MSERLRDCVRRAGVVDDALGMLNVMRCLESQELKTRFDAAEKRLAQYCDKKNRDLTGIYSERARKIQREAKANIALFGQRISDHKACCLICKSETEGPPPTDRGTAR
jgi:hypothetical protein